MFRSKAVISLVLVGGAALSCASGGAVPADKLARSQAAVRSARELGAEQNPQAAFHLGLAQQQIEQARKLIADGENDRAGRLLERAESDADLAMNLTREAAAISDAQKTMQQAQALRSSLQQQQQQQPQGGM